MATKMLKADVQKILSKLTTHIPAEDYEASLAKLEALNANFLEPEMVNACIQSNFETCDFKPKPKQNSIKSFFKVLLILVCFMPYLIWKKWAQPKIKELEFTSTFRFAIAVTLVPIWLLLVASVLWFSFSGAVAICFFFSSLVIALLAVKL